MLVKSRSGTAAAQPEGELKVSSRSEATARLLDTLWKGEASAVSSLSEIDVVGTGSCRWARIEDPVGSPPK